MTNLNFLFFGYAIGWTVVFLYLFWIGRCENSLRRRLAELQAMMEEQWKK